MAGLSSIGIKFEYDSENPAPGNFVEIKDLLEVPDLGGDPEKIDVTCLADTVKKSINGVKDLGDLSFKFLYNNSAADSNFRVLKGLESSTKTYKITFPDTTTFQFDAEVNVKVDGAGVNAVLTFTVSMALQSEITVTDPA